jgi:hypothetical protein
MKVSPKKKLSLLITGEIRNILSLFLSRQNVQTPSLLRRVKGSKGSGEKSECISARRALPFFHLEITGFLPGSGIKQEKQYSV